MQYDGLQIMMLRPNRSQRVETVAEAKSVEMKGRRREEKALPAGSGCLRKDEGEKRRGGSQVIRGRGRPKKRVSGCRNGEMTRSQCRPVPNARERL